MPSKQPRNLMMKFRLSITRRMSKGEAIKKLKRAIRSGMVPEGIEIHWIDWESGKEGHVSEGSIDGARLNEMRILYNALAVADMRAERVD